MLRTDCVDILQLHAVTPDQYPLAAVEVIPALARVA
jgi:aryl-alcohol dehydrogenase-like predicted oxidoreductase